jgi:hypothetical protein
MTLPTPFADDSHSASIDTLTIENGRDRIAIYGTLDITRDKAGLTIARQLADYLAKIVGVLQADSKLPVKQTLPEEPKRVSNPFT